MHDVEKQVAEAIKLFWLVREKQNKAQGSKTGEKDAGLRAAVTGGKHLDGFSTICRQLLVEAGVPEAHVYWQRSTKQLPGYYRAQKDWDLVVVADGLLLAVVEFKAQVGPSFGNNANNRAEEAIGSAVDLRAAYREGKFAPSPSPWLGYVFILEDCLGSQTPVKVVEPHFQVFEEFRSASYAKRYEILLTKLQRERLYDGVALILTKKDGRRFNYPSTELSFTTFAAGLYGRAVAFAKSQGRDGKARRRKKP